MKISSNINRKTLLFFLLVIIGISVTAQDDSEILEAYEDYTELARELVYLHLNKSTFIKGEDLGFTAYVLDKKDKQPSLLTTNLYVTIEDLNNKTVKSKLVRVVNGISSNKFELDSTFSSGDYVVKAYTNWMRNFKEQNYFVESIKVIDPKTEKYIEEQFIDNTMDAQFLPESGHLLHGVENNVGVVIKDKNGFGIKNIFGEVVDHKGNLVSSFKTNKLGIGKFPLIAQTGIGYTINISYNNKDFNFALGHKVEKNGIILSVKRLKSKIFVSVITNEETLPSIKNERYGLMVHNGDGYDFMDIYFDDKTTITKVFESSNSAKGINILTLFDENDQPIAERMFFNHEGLDVIQPNNLSVLQKRDSVNISLGFNTADTEKFNTLSVSVLPEETMSYNRHHNIISYIYLQPYLNSSVESGKYYFTDINEQKKYELDNLLITQGWSSYDWNLIFEDSPNQNYAFEQGISIKANLNSKEIENDVTYMVHATYEQGPIFVGVEDGKKEFVIDNIFVQDNDSLYLSKIKPNDKLSPARLYLQAFPSTIPLLGAQATLLKPKTSYRTSATLNKNKMSFGNRDGVEKLDEIVITTEVDKIKTRTRELNKHSFGTVKILSESDRLIFNTIDDYLNANMVYGSDGIYTTGRHANGPNSNASAMAIFLDDVYLADPSMISNLTLDDIDYIEINRGGLGLGGRGFNGGLMFYTLNKSGFRSSIKKTAQKHQLPLTFSAKKKFYVPKYRYYSDDFYKGYGVIDWKPELKVDDKGNTSFTIAKPEVPIILFIEGITNNGLFIFEEKTISLNALD